MRLTLLLVAITSVTIVASRPSEALSQDARAAVTLRQARDTTAPTNASGLQRVAVGKPRVKATRGPAAGLSVKPPKGGPALAGRKALPAATEGPRNPDGASTLPGVERKKKPS